MCFNHESAVITLETNHVPKDEYTKGLPQGLGLSESEDEEFEDIIENFAS